MSRTKIIPILLYFMASIETVQATTVFSGGSSIGGGGDPLYFYLEATRSKMLDVIRTYRSKPEVRETFCRQPRITDEQKTFCQEFFSTTSDQIFSLNSGDGKTRFVIRTEPLVVVGPGGEDIPVAARTPLGPMGEIEFHGERLRSMGPHSLLMLMAHEFGHKVAWNSQYINDLDSMGPFTSGREFLDVLGEAVLEFAKDNNLIGNQFGLYDRFDCEIRQPQSRPVMTRTTNRRTFIGAQEAGNYLAGFGFGDDSSAPSVLEYNAKIMMRVVIKDVNSCALTPEASSARKTDFELVRIFNPTVEIPDPSEDKLISKSLPGVNPLCTDKVIPLNLSFGGFEFSCHYSGTLGSTSSYIN